MKTFFRKYYNQIHWTTVAVAFITAFVHDAVPELKPVALMIGSIAFAIMIINTLYEIFAPNLVELEKEAEKVYK